MRILLTNSTLADRSGSELYLRDLAIALRKRDHHPIAYSPLLGDVAGDLRDAAIPVTNDLRTIKVAPDVIHGQHHLETMTALAHFPGVPALYVCHGWLPWQEAPPSYPRLLRYVAVDDTVLDRLVVESGIDPARVQTLYNFVDLTRFAQRGALPAKPRRGLVYNSRASEENFGDVVREACAASGIEIDVLGYGADRPVREPERLLAQYDVVFARARSALEAMAVGCAVIVCDPSGIAGLVTTKNFDAMRRRNFGVRTLTKPVSRDL
ncbi:MAG TPA: glycosyltransferase, partial [Thermoanaerobaculia bacterium]|nr:glycosyltransferase [Thermoanaerobaculia bacterium]